MFHFYAPWFALLLVFPFLVRKFFPLREKDTLDGFTELYFPTLERLKNAFKFSSRQVQENKKQPERLFFTLLSLSWLFLVLALMQPEKVDQFTQVKNKGYDLMLAVDISASM